MRIQFEARWGGEKSVRGLGGGGESRFLVFFGGV